MKVTKNIDIYLTNKRPVKTIDVVQGDTGIQLVFTLKDFTIPNGSSATLFVQKPSGKFVYQNDNITASANTITIDLENQALTEYGEIPYQVSIENGTDTVTTFTGLMNVQPSLKDSGAIKSNTVVRAFDELTVEKLAEFQARAETAARGVIATIPEDYTEMTAKVNESANAIKGHLSGAVVRSDDVSPVEHNPKVKVICPENVDPSTVTVTRCGKNLFPYPFNGTVYDNGITFTDNGDGSITLNGTNNGESNSVLYITKDTYITIPKGEYIGVPSTSGVSIMGVEKGGGYLTLNKTLILNEAVTLRSIYVQIGKGVTETYNNIKIRPMLELGKISTEYEMYCGEKYTPNADGTIEGLTSVSPTMTLLTDTEGVTVECEYNKDTNKVISKLADALGITI